MTPAKKVSVPLVGFADAARKSAGIERVIDPEPDKIDMDAARKSAGIESIIDFICLSI